MSQQQPQLRVAESQPMQVIPGSIHARLMNVMRAVNAITKGRTNTQQDFKYRGVDDVFNELHAHCATAGVMPAVRKGMLGGADSCTVGGLAISLRM